MALTVTRALTATTLTVGELKALISNADDKTIVSFSVSKADRGGRDHIRLTVMEYPND
jgi:hypothetical protein